MKTGTEKHGYPKMDMEATLIFTASDRFSSLRGGAAATAVAKALCIFDALILSIGYH